MATVNITKDTLQSTIDDNEIVLIDFWAEWCGPCRSFAPTYEAISEKYPNVKFAKVDTEAEQELAANFGIRSIPTLVAFRDQIGIFSQPGALPGEALEDLIRQIEALDMDEIRKEIESEADGSEAELGSEADGSEADGSEAELGSEADEAVSQEASATT